MASTEKVGETNSKPEEQVPVTSLPTDDEDSDWEDLDDVLDDFNKPKQPAKAAAVADSNDEDDFQKQLEAEMIANFMSDVGKGKVPDDILDQMEFPPEEVQNIANQMKEKGLTMEDMLKIYFDYPVDLQAPVDPYGLKGTDKGKEPETILKRFGGANPMGLSEEEIKDLAETWTKMGINIGDVLDVALNPPAKPELGLAQLLGAAANGQVPGFPAEKQQEKAAEKGEAAAGKRKATAPGEGGKFQETIQETLKRMKEGGDKATAEAATNPDKELFEKFAEMLDAGMAGDGADGLPDNMQEMFSGIMKDISNKEMLYEPMQEYHAKYGPWLEANKGKVPQEDFERYETQARIVKEIVEKFDEEGYSDDKPECLAYIWDHMQQMEAAGSPPEGVIAQPQAPDMSQFAPNGQIPPECAQQ